MTNTAHPIAIYYEHPDWFRPLFSELDRKKIPYVRINAREHSYDPSAANGKHSLWFNRMSSSAYLRGAGQAIFYTLGLLEQRISLEDYSVSNRGLRSGLVGTVEQVTRQVEEFEAAGVDLLLLQFSPQFEEMERFADTVIQSTRKQSAFPTAASAVEKP